VNADFNADFQFSLGERQRVDLEILASVIPNCEEVFKTTPEMDRKGIDYVAVLDGGAVINIDAKARRKGAVRPGSEPNLALETWSVCPRENQKGKPGWTCSRTSDVDLILYTFDRSDTDKFYLIPFQHLRIAFQRNFKAWREKYPLYRQQNTTWDSEAMFVPASVVLKAVAEQMAWRCK